MFSFIACKCKYCNVALSRKVKIIDASNDFKEGKNQNELLPEHVAKIVKAYQGATDVEKYMRVVAISELAENDYNLSVSSYVVAKDNRVKINIEELNNEVSKTVKKIDKLRTDINAIIKEIEA